MAALPIALPALATTVVAVLVAVRLAGPALASLGRGLERLVLALMRIATALARWDMTVLEQPREHPVLDALVKLRRRGDGPARSRTEI